MGKRKEPVSGRGFSLMELMVTIVLMLVLSSVAMYSISRIKPRYEARAEARELVINLKKAKLEAVKRNRNVMILFTPGTGNAAGYQAFVDLNADAAPDANDISLFTRQVPANINLGTNFPGNITGFNSRGMLQGANGSVTIQTTLGTGIRTYTISLTQAGNVRLQ